MKILVILVPILLQLASGNPDYADTTTGEFVTGNCQSAPAGSIKSPIFVEESLCAIYGTFSLTMEDIPASGAFATAMPVVDTLGAPSAAYTGAKLESNGTSYTSTDYLIRTASEHVLFRDGRQADAEIQILMDSDAGDGSKAILSFLVIETPSGTGSNIYSNSVNAKVIPSGAGADWQVNFNSLAQRISKHADYEVFLNMFTYEGTQTWGTCDAVRWFIYGSELYIDSATLEAIRTQTQTYTNAANKVGASDLALTHNARPYTGTGGGGGAVVIYRMCYTGYFKVHLDVNYGLWFGMVSILLFFLFTLSYGDKPIKDYDYHERVSTIHPIVSIFTVGNEIHTVKTRASLLLAMVTVHGLFSSVFFRDASDPKKSSNVIVFAIYSMLIDWPITLFVGGILRKYYVAKYQYYKTKEEAWDQKAQNRLFGFYTAVFVIAVVGWSFCVWNMAELHPEIDEEPSKLWVAAFFIGLGLELLLIYPLVCVLARSSNFIRRIAKSVGFMYDNLCHETYMDFLKHD